jgi:hypothetical protein
LHRQFSADDWTDAVLTRGNGKSLRAVHAVPIEQSHRRHFQFRRDFS